MGLALNVWSYTNSDQYQNLIKSQDIQLMSQRLLGVGEKTCLMAEEHYACVYKQRKAP